MFVEMKIKVNKASRRIFPGQDLLRYPRVAIFSRRLTQLKLLEKQE